MRANLKLSSVQLMISFFVFSSAVIILQNFYAASDTSFLMNLICVVLGVLIAFLFFVPSIIIRSQTKLDFMSFAHLKTPNAIIFTSAFYAMYFVYAAGYFLVTYTEMFNQKLNPEGNIYVIAFLLLSACVYAGHDNGHSKKGFYAAWMQRLCLCRYDTYGGADICNRGKHSARHDGAKPYTQCRKGSGYGPGQLF